LFLFENGKTKVTFCDSLSIQKVQDEASLRQVEASEGIGEYLQVHQERTVYSRTMQMR